MLNRNVTRPLIRAVSLSGNENFVFEGEKVNSILHAPYRSTALIGRLNA